MQIDLAFGKYDLHYVRKESSRHVHEGTDHLVHMSAVQIIMLFHRLKTQKLHLSIGAEILFSVSARASGRAYYSHAMHAPADVDTSYINKRITGPGIFGPCLQLGYGFHLGKMPCSINARGSFSLFGMLRMNANAVLVVYPFGKK